MRSRLRLAIVFGSAMATLAATAPAEAESCTEDPRACGRKAFAAGVEAFKAKDYKTALDRFREAYEIQAHPIVVFNLALAEAKNGLALEALAHLKQLEDDPSADKELIEQGRAEREKIERDVGRINVEVAAAQSIVVEIDGRAAEAVDGLYRVNPGSHAVRVTADGTVALERTVKVHPGERLTLSVDRTREVVVQKDTPPPRDEQPAASSKGLDPMWFYLSAGVTVAFAGATVWSGVDTNAAKDDFDNRPSDLTRAEEQKLLDDGKAKETRTNILIAVTAIGAAGTAALGIFAVDWGGSAEKDAFVNVGPTGVSLSGRF